MTKKTARKSTKKSDNNTLYIGGGVIALGAAIAVLTGKGASNDANTSPSIPAKSTSVTATKPLYATAAKTAATVPTASTPGATSTTTSVAPKNHVFVDSFDGETIWGGIDTTRWASMAVINNITRVFNKAYIGKLTGKTHSQSLWSWVEVGVLIDGVLRKFWVDKKEVKLMTEAERDRYLKGGGGTLLTSVHLTIIRNFFNK